jgi:hypothetical protein
MLGQRRTDTRYAITQRRWSDVVAPRVGRRGGRSGRWLGLMFLVLVLAATFGAGAAHAYLVRGADGRLYGILPRQGALRSHALSRAKPPKVSYWGGTVMLGTTLRLIFWGPPGSFSASYQSAITQWAQGLAADSGRTTNEFSVASLYYTNRPRRYISRNVLFGGAVSDTRPYPDNGCLNPGNPDGTCLSDAQQQAEIRRVIAAQRWPRDKPSDPRNQYLILTPYGVDSCQDQLDTSCTFSQDGYCAYHSSFAVGRTAVVYSILPNIPDCGSGQAPAGVLANANADGTLDSAIHEVLESATDPGTRGGNDYGWTDNPGNEIGDLCVLDAGAVYGAPLGGSLQVGSAFNQLIAGRSYYTQEIWAIKTRWSAAPGCVQRIGPSPVFTASAVGLGAAATFDGSQSYDLVGPITVYAWNYGDGSPIDTLRGARGVHVYTRPGVYQVSLTVGDASGLTNLTTQTRTVVVR